MPPTGIFLTLFCSACVLVTVGMAAPPERAEVGEDLSTGVNSEIGVVATLGACCDKLPIVAGSTDGILLGTGEYCLGVSRDALVLEDTDVEETEVDLVAVVDMGPVVIGIRLRRPLLCTDTPASWLYPDTGSTFTLIFLVLGTDALDDIDTDEFGAFEGVEFVDIDILDNVAPLEIRVLTETTSEVTGLIVRLLREGKEDFFTSFRLVLGAPSFPLISSQSTFL